MSKIDELRARFAKSPDRHQPWVKTPMSLMLSLATHFDAISSGMDDSNQFACIIDLRLKFGPHTGVSLASLAGSDKMYVRDLYRKFKTAKAVDQVVQGVIRLVLGEDEREILLKLEAADKESSS